MPPSRPLALAALAAVVLAGCDSRSRPDSGGGLDDVFIGFDVVGLDLALPDEGALEVSLGDAPPPDGRLDGGGGGGGDAAADGGDAAFDVVSRDENPPELDVAVPDAPPVDGGACMTVAAPSAFGSESRVLTRRATVAAETGGFAALASVLRDGAESAWLHRVRPDGTVIVSGAVTDVPAGREVRAATFARETETYLVAYSSNATGNAEVYLQRAQSNARPILGAQLRVTNDADASESPEVVQTASGFLVAWRSVAAGGGGAALVAASADRILATAGARTPVTAAGENVTAFRLVGSADADVYAVVYAVATAGGTELRAQRLSAAGAPMGTAIVVASGDLGDDVDAALRDQDAVVAWTQPRASGRVRVRRVAVAPGGAGTADAVELTAAPGGAARVGVALDGAGYVLGYRATVAGGATYLAMARLGADLALRDASLLAGAAAGGRVGVSARGMGLYGLAWADDFASGTVTRLAVARCP